MCLTGADYIDLADVLPFHIVCVRFVYLSLQFSMDKQLYPLKSIG